MFDRKPYTLCAEAKLKFASNKTKKLTNTFTILGNKKYKFYYYNNYYTNVFILQMTVF